MNKRIRKKRRKLRSISVGNHAYTHKEIERINKAHIGYMNIRLLYPKIKKPKLTRPRVRLLINYIYKNRMKYAKSLRFEPPFIGDFSLGDRKPIMISHQWRFNIL